MNVMAKVYFVGAGSGDVGLLTYKGGRALKKADVVLYDKLVNPLLLYLTKPGAERIDVGKTPFRTGMSQEEINQLLLDFAGQGKEVVRLKGGDPAIFGRVAEEIEVLRAAGFDYEVVPGLTAATAASIYADIPLTQRLLAERVLIVTPQQKIEAFSETDFSKILRDTTVVIYMGVSKLAQLQSLLKEQAVKGEIPAAMIENGTYGRQRTLVTDIAHLAEAAAANEIKNPALIILGQAVHFRQGEKSWFEKLPAFGKRLLYLKKTPPTMEDLLEMAETGADFWVKVEGERHEAFFDAFDRDFIAEGIDETLTESKVGK